MTHVIFITRQSCLKCRSQRCSCCACAPVPRHVSCKGQHACKLLQKGNEEPDVCWRAMYSIFSSPLGLISKFGRYADAYAPLPLASATHSYFAAVLSCRSSRRCCSASFSTISSLEMPHNPSKRISFPLRATCEQQIWCFATTYSSSTRLMRRLPSREELSKTYILNYQLSEQRYSPKT